MAVDPHLSQRGPGGDHEFGLSGGHFERPHVAGHVRRLLQFRLVGKFDRDGVAGTAEFIVRAGRNVEDDTAEACVVASADGDTGRGFGVCGGDTERPECGAPRCRAKPSQSKLAISLSMSD